ncbi:MAG: efflux RND transporter permease subunit, partial [Xanthomonadales bacterium]|nr:efflux RND transporter permease subunit [Xanthomonadales bacterium]
MLNALVEVSLRYKFLVLIGFLVIGFLGLRAVNTVPIDAFPDVTPVQVNIYTESPGLAAEDVEQLMTFPVESALAGLPKVQEIRSVSLFGLSYVSVYFEDDMDIYFARQLVNERLQEVGDRLPEGFGKPSMGPNTASLGQVLWYTVERKPGVSEEQVSDMDLRTLQDWIVRLVLRTAPGVDDVMSWGGGEREFQVLIDPQRLYARGLGFGDVLDALPINNGQVGGNVMDVGAEQYLVRGLGLVKSAEDIGAIVLKAEDGVPVYVRDVARVVEAPAPRFGAVTRDGEEVVLGMALARLGENAKAVVEAVEGKLGIVRDAMPEGVDIKPIYARTELVNKAVSTAVWALIEGSILVAIILFLFLGEFRSAVVVIVALPMAMLIAFIGMQQFGLSANLMSLAGLAIGIGMMVDGAVVIVENAFRIMAERREHGGPVDRTSAVLAAAREVANPIAFAIIIIIVVFLPLFSLEGLEGKMFKPMAFNIAFAMAGSLILALTLIPVLAALILKPKEERDTWLVRSVKRIYVPLLARALVRKGVVVTFA